ncbi:hypothetical protein M1116_04000 [Patescibacteria group bacterium]|nr:hypothetical protein [Patescibacteria group bacterium]
MERVTLSACIQKLIALGVSVELILQITKTRPDALGEWLGEVREPSGETLIRMLWLCWQYDLYPGRLMPNEIIRGLATIIACDLLPPVEISKTIGFPTETPKANANQGLFGYLLGRTGKMLPEREERAQSLIRYYRERFPPKPSVTPRPEKVNGSRSAYAADLVIKLAEVLKPLLEADEPGEREKFRRRIQQNGEDTLFEASNMLSAVCSESARKEWRRSSRRR